LRRASPCVDFPPCRLQATLTNDRGWTGDGSAVFLTTLKIGKKNRPEAMASGLIFPLALAFTLTRPFRRAERKVLV